MVTCWVSSQSWHTVALFSWVLALLGKPVTCEFLYLPAFLYLKQKQKQCREVLNNVSYVSTFQEEIKFWIESVGLKS